MNEALKISESTNSRNPRCAYCHDSVSLENEHRCTGCEVLLHHDCCSQVTECPTIGCSVPIQQRPQAQVGEGLGTSISAPESTSQGDQTSNFSHFTVGAKTLSKLAYRNLPIFFILSAIAFMLLGMVGGEIYYQLHDLVKFEGAQILDNVSFKYLREGNQIVTVSQSYLDSLESRRLASGAGIGFLIGIVLRFFYLVIAAFGRSVNKTSEIKEK